jgi:RHS repeat-associated protein
MKGSNPRARGDDATDTTPAPAAPSAGAGVPNALTAPSITLPKGGGAIRGMGEKFAANPVTGTGSMTVPITTSPGRSGFGPQLALSYDSGSGNGPFGFGWSLSLPSITRKTDKGIPEYRDADDSDVFILSGSEDLVPELDPDPAGGWALRAGQPVIYERRRTVTVDATTQTYTVRRYRPRIEGLFARIERWTRADGEVHWRSITPDNVMSLYGADASSRIADPDDPTRVFSWLISETRDDKGNAVVYEYKADDATGIVMNLPQERNRGGPDDPRRRVNRYPKRIRYGNRQSLLDANGVRPHQLSPQDVAAADWMFEVVFDYGDHDQSSPTPRDDQAVDPSGARRYPWPQRTDPFSVYRSGFEVRTSRLCRRVLMFHHFPDVPDEVGVDCLVRSTDLTHSAGIDLHGPNYAMLLSVAHTGYRRTGTGGYVRRTAPPVTFTYTKALVDDAVRDVDRDSLENLPAGLADPSWQWVDLHGEGLSGLLAEQGSGWFYKPNLSPLAPGTDGTLAAVFGPLQPVTTQPRAALGGGAQFMDLAGDGQPDVVVLDGPTPGFYEHNEADGWKPFRQFISQPTLDFVDHSLRLVDLNGDGHSDVLRTESDTLWWYASLGEDGFGPVRRTPTAGDEERGPRVVFAEATQTVHLADLSGDGLTDLVRIRNGEVCYWPNLGYGRFGAKVTMDNSPRFDQPDAFDPARIRLADIDGSGTTDLIYLHRDGVRLYFNQSGNAWSATQTLTALPVVDELSAVTVVDLLGNGTACLVWSSPLPGDAGRQMRYVDLMGGNKPHLLVGTGNNLGAETRVTYAPSTKFYLQDKRDGVPWITRLPFPVHVVERTEVYDHIGRNRFSSRYAYHHGYFDGTEREFRGFGMVEQWDTETFEALTAGGDGNNIDAATHVPPLHTKTWFHTGAHLEHQGVSNYYAGLRDAGDHGEYFREPGLTDVEARALLLPDTMLPAGLTAEEEREACRALKGTILRQETYADDAGPGASAAQIRRAATPYTVSEQNVTVRRVQPRGPNRHTVFFTHPAEAIAYHYERDPADPRVAHTLTLEVDGHGNILKQATIGYGRRKLIRVLDNQGQPHLVGNPGLSGLTPADQAKQTTTLLTYTENRVTNAVHAADTHRNPQPCETRTYELTEYTPTGPAGRFRYADLIAPDPTGGGGLRHRYSSEVTYEAGPSGPLCRRLIECQRNVYRRDDLTGMLALGELENLGLVGETYQLAFTPGLLTSVFQRPREGQPPEPLLPNLGDVVGVQGGYLLSQTLKADNRFPADDPDDHWWIGSGRAFFTPNPTDSASGELSAARDHFFLLRRYRDPFGQHTVVDFDNHDLLPTETRDPLGNRIKVDINDYRVLQPRLVSDPNRNQTEVAFDTLGMVVGTAVMGKPHPMPTEGDTLAGFVTDPPHTELETFFTANNPHPHTPTLLGGATTRILYDLDGFKRSREAHPDDPDRWLPTCAATLTRETHVAALLPSQQTRIQLSFSYSDGFGRTIQSKAQAEPGPIVEGGPVVDPRWVGSGWIIVNNKGNPVRQYEPFFSETAGFEFAVLAGVSPVVFFDPADRMIATLHPNHTYGKVVFDPWHQTSYDVNDTCAPRDDQTGDPRTDPDIAGYVATYFAKLSVTPVWETWHQQRINSALGSAERTAAQRAADHANTPTTVHADALGRPFLTVARNRVICPGHSLHNTEASFETRVDLDIEGNQRLVRDADQQANDPLGRIVMRYAYDMLGNRIYQLSMEAGARWTLNDVTGNPIRAWDSRGHTLTTRYDGLRRPLEQTVRGSTADSDQRTLNRDILVQTIQYGEPASPAQEAEVQRLNLRTRIYRRCDSAGAVTNARFDPNGNPTAAYDFKGNLLHSTRQLATDYKGIPDWQHAPGQTPAERAAELLDTETFQGAVQYDALNRAVQTTTPHSDLPHTKRHITQPVYNAANLLERIDVWLERDTEPVALLDPQIDPPTPALGVSGTDYNAKGQRLHIEYKNGASTRYEYDPLTLRLTHLYTRRGPAFTEDCDNPQPPPPTTIAAPETPPVGQPCGLLNLQYTYDPAGNITHIHDQAQQAIFFRNHRVDPSNDYTYDALYRLIEATGREHLGQTGAPATAPDSFNTFHTRLPHPNEANAMGTYTERYVYDAVGNFEKIHHHGSDPADPDWTRHYRYGQDSLIENGSGGTWIKKSNRLSSTTLDPNGTHPRREENYQHDAHGNMTLPHLTLMRWNHFDQLQATSQQVDNTGTPETTYYTYDASGHRVRKVTDRHAPSGQIPKRREERIYLGASEIHRMYETDTATATREQETLHTTDGRQHIVLVEICTVDSRGIDPTLRQLIRYQIGNHLGSINLELDDQARIITYEEYAPYGSTTYQAARPQLETAKRYRYAGEERDQESGLCYHGARYYAPWLGKWVSTDPIGIADHSNLYAFARLNPVKWTDTTGFGVWDWVHENVLEPVADFIDRNDIDDAVAGFGDEVSFGLSRNVRKALDVDTTVDYESTAYKGGAVVGVGTGLVIGGAGVANVIARHGPKRGLAIVGGFLAGQQGITLGLNELDPSGTASGIFNTALLVSPLATGPTSAKARFRPPTEAEAAAAVEGSLSTGPFVEIPSTGLQSIPPKYKGQFEMGEYGQGGYQHKLHVDAATSAPGNTGTAKTTVRWHDADPTAPAGTTSRTQSTMAIEQAKGNRRLVPDANQPEGRWVQAGKHGTATAGDRSAMHIPLHSDPARVPYIWSGAAGAAGISLLLGMTGLSPQSGQVIDMGNGAIIQDSLRYVPDEQLVLEPIVVGVGGRF